VMQRSSDDRVEVRRGALPLRDALLPNLGSLLDFDARICAGGMGALFAVARAGTARPEFLIPVQRRSGSVADGRGQLALLPKGFHQDCAGVSDEVDIRWTLWRELYEEVFDGKEAQGDAVTLGHDWYLQDCPGVAWFHQPDQRGFRCESVAFGLNAINGNYEFAKVLAVTDETYRRTFQRDMLFTSEEFADPKGIKLSSQRRDHIKNTLLLPDWTSEGLFQFVEGLLWLKDELPEWVDLPDIERELSEIA
jgi:hypothetical protein